MLSDSALLADILDCADERGTYVAFVKRLTHHTDPDLSATSGDYLKLKIKGGALLMRTFDGSFEFGARGGLIEGDSLFKRGRMPGLEIMEATNAVRPTDFLGHEVEVPAGDLGKPSGVVGEHALLLAFTGHIIKVLRMY